MAQSLPPVSIPKNTWIDLYAATGITAGVRMIIQNTGSADAILTESTAEPATSVGNNALQPKEYLTNNSANIGAWAFSELGTKLQVEEA